MSNSDNIVFLKDQRAIEEAAAVWIARMDSRALSLTERKDFQDWLDQSPQHRDALERMSSIWGGCDILDELNYIDTKDEQPQNGRRWAIGAIAACLMLALGIQQGGFFDHTQTDHYVTFVGAQKTIDLVDGSRIILNTDSEVDINITRESRRINLIRGEAHFEVASDAERPFRVYAGDGIVKAVGTAFTVFVHAEAVEVTVTEGVVELLTEIDMTPIAALTVGQNAVFAQKVERLEKMSDEALDRKLLWREGYIAFAGEPLSDVVADISRYTDIKIEIEDSLLENTPIGGYFKVGDVEGLLEVLENGFGLRVVRLDGGRIRLAHAP